MTHQNQNDWFLKSRLKLRHLRLIVALDEQKNLHRAAETMCIPQPAASKLLAEAEAIFGHRLFDRHARGLTPNLHGDVIIRHANIALRTLTQAGEEISALSQGYTGLVSIGTVAAPMVELVAEAIERVKERYPRLQISIDMDVSDALASKLLEGRVDFNLARLPPGYDPSAFVYHELRSEQIHFVCGEKHPLAKKRVVSLSDLAAWPWVLQPAGSPLRTAIERAFTAAGVAFMDNVVSSTSALTAMIMVDRSRYITAMEWQVAQLLSEIGRFQVLSPTQKIVLEPYGMLRLAEKKLSPGATRMYEAILELSAERGQE